MSPGGGTEPAPLLASLVFPLCPAFVFLLLPPMLLSTGMTGIALPPLLWFLLLLSLLGVEGNAAVTSSLGSVQASALVLSSDRAWASNNRCKLSLIWPETRFPPKPARDLGR